MQRRAAAMYVIFFVVIAVAALGFITITDAPSDSMDEADYQLGLGGSFVVDGVEYELTAIDDFTAELSFHVEAADQELTIGDGDEVNITGTYYRLELPEDEDDPENATLVETFPEHHLNTTEDADGNTLVEVEPGTWILEEQYLLDEYGPREEIELTVGTTIEFIPEDDDTPREATVGEITGAGVTIAWVGPMDDTVLLQRDAVNLIGDTEFGTLFIGDESIQLTTDMDAFEEHLEAHEVWDERYQGFWGVGVLSLLAAIMIGALSYLPQRR